MPGGRCAYRDAAANPAPDWEKYLYTYVLWGRLLYNPGCDPRCGGACCARDTERGARPLEAALGAGDAYPADRHDRAHAIRGAGHLQPGVLHEPVDCGACRACAVWRHAVAEGVRQRKPARPAAVLDHRRAMPAACWPVTATPGTHRSRSRSGSRTSRTRPLRISPRRTGRRPRRRPRRFARAACDIRIQLGLGRFFAAKFRSAALYAVFERSGSRRALEAALDLYRQARHHWARMAEEAARVYAADITFGPLPHQRGHWTRPAAGDRRRHRGHGAGTREGPGKQARLGPRARRPSTRFSDGRSGPSLCAATPLLGLRARDRPLARRHVPGAGVALVCGPPYRRVNQAERYQATDMHRRGDAWHATVPAAYTDSAFPLQYYFEFREGTDRAWMHPGFASDLASTPYFVVRRARSAE